MKEYYILSYGSLKNDSEFFKRLKRTFPESIFYVKTVEVKGFDLYKIYNIAEDSYENFLGAKFPFKPSEEVFNMDIIKVNSLILFNHIKAEVISRDFIEYKINIEEFNCSIFLYNGEVRLRDRLTTMMINEKVETQL